MRGGPSTGGGSLTRYTWLLRVLCTATAKGITPDELATLTHDEDQLFQTLTELQNDGHVLDISLEGEEPRYRGITDADRERGYLIAHIPLNPDDEPTPTLAESTGGGS